MSSAETTVMSSSNQVTEMFDTFAKVLGRCTVLGFSLLLLFFGVYTLAGGMIYRLHGQMFGLSKHELDVVIYGAIAFLKLSVLTFFLIPWAAVRLTVARSGAR
jgi:hypothetical protein